MACGKPCRGAVEREAARILASLIDHIDATSVSDDAVVLNAKVPLELFDRLSVWGACCQDCEIDPQEPDADLEDERGAA